MADSHTAALRSASARSGDSPSPTAKGAALPKRPKSTSDKAGGVVVSARPRRYRKPKTLEQHKEAATTHPNPAQKTQSLFMLGYFHRTGQGGAPQDLSIARQYYEDAADCGHKEAQHNLGAMYWSGDGVDIDAQRAVSWFILAAEKGNASSQLMLGLAHLHGVGFKKQGADDPGSGPSPLQAIKYLKLAAESGDDTRAMYHLGMVYMNGVPSVGDKSTFTIDPNLKLAIKYLNRAARRKHADAKTQLEVALERKQDEESMRLYNQNTQGSNSAGRKAEASVDNKRHEAHKQTKTNSAAKPVVQSNSDNKGMPATPPQKITKSSQKEQPSLVHKQKGEAKAYFAQQLTLPQLERMAVQGDMESQFNLAYLYRTGSSDSVPMPDNGTAGKVGLRKKKGSTPVRRRSQKVHAVDMHKALALYLQAAEQGHQMAQHNIGCVYLHGTKDDTTTKKNSRVKISHLTVVGNMESIVKRDVQKACSWLEKSAAQGNLDSCLLLAQVYWDTTIELADDDEQQQQMENACSSISHHQHQHRQQKALSMLHRVADSTVSVDRRVVKACHKLGCVYLGDVGEVHPHEEENNETFENEDKRLNKLAKAVKYLGQAAAFQGHLPVPAQDSNTGLPSPLPHTILQGGDQEFELVPVAVQALYRLASAYLDTNQYKGIPLPVTATDSDTVFTTGTTSNVYRVEQGVSLLKAASARGHGPSQLRLGFLFDPNLEASSQFDGGIAKDGTLAYRCYCAASHAAPVDVVLGQNGEYIWTSGDHEQEHAGGPGSVAAQAHNQLGVMYMQDQVPSEEKETHQKTPQQAAVGQDRLGILHLLVAAAEPLGSSADAKSNLRMLLQNSEDRSLVLEQASHMWGEPQETGNGNETVASSAVESDDKPGNSQEPSLRIMTRLKQLLDS